MGRFVTIGKASGIQLGKMSLFKVDGRAVTVANVEGTLHAFDDTCTHEDCSLADGDLERAGDRMAVTCPCHFAQFDVKTGAVLAAPATVPIKVYPVRIEGDDLQVEI